MRINLIFVHESHPPESEVQPTEKVRFAYVGACVGVCVTIGAMAAMGYF